MLLPAPDFLQELRMDVLEGLGLLGKLLLEPLDGRCLVRNEKLKLKNLLDRHSLLIILSRLIRQEIHAFTHWEALFQARVELGSRQGNRYTSLDMEGDHAVEEQVILALGNDFNFAALGNKNRELFHVGSDKVPDSIFGA